MDRVRKRIKEDGSIEEIHKIVVHTFRVGDVEDPDIYAAEPILDWEKGEAGKFVMKHALENNITWHRELDFATYGYRYAIMAELPGPRATEYYLKWGR
jgi:hypothetical protein